VSHTPLAFLCFDVEHDEEARAAFIAELDGRETVTVDHWSVPPQTPRDNWNDRVRTNISRCDLMIVIVGDASAGSDGVRREIGFAKRGNVPYFGVYADGAGSGTKLPEGLAANRMAKWDWQTIGAGVKQLMREGKNQPQA
jgi:hypothetical protein